MKSAPLRKKIIAPDSHTNLDQERPLLAKKGVFFF